MKAVNKFPGYEHVKVSLEVTPRGTGMSFTKLRNILKDPKSTPDQQYALWAQGFDEQRLGKDWILHLMDISRKGMGVSQQTTAQPAPQPVVEVRLFNALVRPSLLEKKLIRTSSRQQEIMEGLPRNAKEKKLYELLEFWGHFISFKTVDLGKTNAVDQNAKQEIMKMRQHYLGPVINGMTFNEITKGDLWQNPKVIPHLLKYIYQGIPYIEERIKKFIVPNQQQTYLSAIDKIKSLYREVVAQYSGQQGVTEKMLPKSSFAGSDKNKLGPAGHLKGKMKRPARQGDLVGGMEESWKDKLAAASLAGAMALGAGNASARVTGKEDPGVNRLTGKPNVVQQNPKDIENPSTGGFSKEYLQKAADPKRFGRFLISVEKAQELLKQQEKNNESYNRKLVPVSEDVESIMSGLIEQIIKNK